MSFRTLLYVFTLGLTLAPIFAASQENVETTESPSDSSASQNSENSGSDLISTLEGIEAAIRSLIREESDEDSQRIAQQTSRGLAAQEEMASWAK